MVWREILEFRARIISNIKLTFPNCKDAATSHLTGWVGLKRNHIALKLPHAVCGTAPGGLVSLGWGCGPPWRSPGPGGPRCPCSLLSPKSASLAALWHHLVVGVCLS